MTKPDVGEAVERIGFDAFRGFSPLFKAYCADPDALSGFYQYDFRRPEDREASASAAVAYERDRETLVRVLRRQNLRWNADDATLDNIEALADPTTVAVVTGQQLGLFGGPLYTLLKTVSALQLASEMQQSSDRRVVPVFWLEGEDHDLDEIASTFLPDGVDVAPVRHFGKDSEGAINRGPVGHLVLGEDIADAIAELDRLLQPSDFHEALVAAVRQCYQAGASFRDAFANLMRVFFAGSGLVLISPDDDELKRLAAPLFAREIEDGDTAAALLAEVSERIEAAGFHAQVRTRPTNLFVTRPGVGRLALDREGDRFSLRGVDETLGRAAVLQMLEDAPESFSPNVVLRPLMQDLLLPTAAYIAGPGEVAYFAQFGPLYDWAGIPMPLIHPRASITLIERGVRRNLDRIGRPVTDFEEEPDRLFSSLVVDQIDADLDASFGRAQQQVNEVMQTLRPVVSSVDASLAKTTDATRASMSKELARLKERVVRAERRRNDELKTRVEKTRGALFPGGTPQERVVSPLYFMNKYGPDLATRLLEALSLDTTQHQVVELS